MVPGNDIQKQNEFTLNDYNQDLKPVRSARRKKKPSPKRPTTPKFKQQSTDKLESHYLKKVINDDVNHSDLQRLKFTIPEPILLSNNNGNESSKSPSPKQVKQSSMQKIQSPRQMMQKEHSVLPQNLKT